MKKNIKPGSLFPDYELPDHTNVKRKLSVLQGMDPMILILSRGHFCPKDRTQLKELLPFSNKCKVGYVKLVTITTDTLLQVNELRTGLGADWPFLYDEKRIVAKDLEIEEYTDPIHNPMIPYTIVLEPGMKIFKIYNGYWYWGRPSIHELHMDLREISQKYRSDYKIDTPDMRKKWEANEKEHFYPFGQPKKQVLAHMNWATDQYEE